MNTNVNEKTPLRQNTKPRRAAVEGTERQERRRTDRHSRTGYKQDGEKRLTSGKGSWGKAVEAGEEHVPVDESVAVAEQIGSIELEVVEAVVNEPVVPHLTLAQYQATLKKPVMSASSSAPRKITTSHPAAQIVKKESEVFVFPEIVKKTSKKAVVTTSTKPAGIDVTKFISVKAVSNVNEQSAERRGEKSRLDRDSRGDRKSNVRTNNRTSSAPSASKMDLKDDRSFPSLGSK